MCSAKPHTLSIIFWDGAMIVDFNVVKQLVAPAALINNARLLPVSEDYFEMARRSLSPIGESQFPIHRT